MWSRSTLTDPISVSQRVGSAPAPLRLVHLFYKRDAYLQSTSLIKNFLIFCINLVKFVKRFFITYRYSNYLSITATGWSYEMYSKTNANCYLSFYEKCIFSVLFA